MEEQKNDIDNFTVPNYKEGMQHSSGKKPDMLIVYYPLLLALMLAVGVYLGTMIGGVPSGSKRETLAKLNNVLNIIEDKYVDEVDRNKLVDDAIASMMHNLDPHSNYMTAEEAAKAREELSGSFGGVGIQFMVYRDTLIVTHLIPGGPAEEEGVEVFDRIVKVDKTSFAGRSISSEEVFNKLRGPYGTKVALTIKRKNKKGFLKKTIIRGQIPVSSVEASIMLDEKTGYIKVSSFGATTYKDFLIASNKLLNRGMKNLVLDLRNNGGGYLDAANNMADEFLEADRMIVYTEGKNFPREETFSTSRGMLEDVKVAVLVNESTASASEIVAGAIQDNDRGIIIGRRTFGKGLVQNEFFPNNDGSSLRLTIARYYTPSRRCIQKPYGDGIDYESELMDRYNNKELFEPDSSIFVDSLKYKTVGGRIVYGGGGIYPDVFVPLDTTGNSVLLSTIGYSNVMDEFAILFAETHPGFEKQYKGYTDFYNRFTASDELLDELLAFAVESFDADKKLLVITENEKKHSKERLKNLLKTEIARLYWNADGLYKVATSSDNEVQIAIKELKKSKLF